MKNLTVTSRFHGLTLIELIISMVVTSLIVVAMGSTLLIAGKALPNSDQPELALLEATQVTQDLVQDLQYAIDVNETGTHAISFSVADRDSDEAQEWIHYQWSGTAGDPLTRQYNDGSTVSILEDVQDFSLNYTWQENTETITTTAEAGTSLLHGYADGSSVVATAVAEDKWYAQYIKPYLSSDAVSWSLTYLDFYCKSGVAALGQFTVQIQTATTGGYPTGVVLAEQSVAESSLTSYMALKRLTFSNVTDLDPDEGICAVFIWDSGTSEACYLNIDAASSTSSYRQFLKSTNDGVSWTLQSSKSLRFYAYGSATSSWDTTLATSRTLQNVEITLNSQDDNRAQFQTHVNLVNQPEVMN